jgi:uncharacterized membrane protein YraQ (UPF0718 family)
LALGFAISGFFYKFTPADLVERHLGEKGLRPILYAAFVGTLLPVCCIGSLPIAITMRRKGAALGPVLAFLIATPATSISALIVCWKLLGLTFTLYIFFAIILMAILMGSVVNRFAGRENDLDRTEKADCCSGQTEIVSPYGHALFNKSKDAIYYAFVTLPREIGVEILIGIGLASFVAVFEPLQYFIRDYLVGYVGYVFILVVGLFTYVCSTASVPMADAFIHSGMSHGQALCYLLVGPITSYSTILVIKKDFGCRILGIYLAIICALSLIYGLAYDYFI